VKRRQSQYYITLGGVALHRVESFGLDAERDIDDYEGVGAGKFNVPGPRAPREWTITCSLLQDGTVFTGTVSWSASEILKHLYTLVGKTDAPFRMVKIDLLYSRANLSALVWLKSFSYKESDEQGVYEVEIHVMEYIPVGVKTTGIPTVKRPGKVPVPPKITVTKKKTVYRAKKKYTGKSSGNITLKNPKTKKPVKNPASIITPSAWNVGTKKGGSITKPKPNSVTLNSRVNYSALDTWKSNVSNAFQRIGTSVKNFFTGKW
jgi:hypothetical protein